MEEKRAFVLEESFVKDVVGKNIVKLIKAMKWTQERFANESGISTAALSKYVRGDALPGLFYLLNLCSMECFKEKGIDLTLEKITNPSFDPEGMTSNKEKIYKYNSEKATNRDFVGNYYSYFFDQTKPIYDQDEKTMRELRYGIISIYEDYNSMAGDTTMRVFALFVKEHEKDIIDALKTKLDEVYALEIPNSEKNIMIKRLYVDTQQEYVGELTVADNHAFVNLSSDGYNDKALIVLYSPQKRKASEYFGGVGSVASVAHGRNHMPVAQKIIISKYDLKCSKEEIGTHLSMSLAPVELTDEAKALAEMCKKLYSSMPEGDVFIDPSDKIAILENRMTQLVRNYIEKNVCCVGTVSEDEDKSIFNLIKEFKRMEEC